jgi:hypothetical protein
MKHWIPNPTRPNGRTPANLVTDRALRYRANASAPEAPAVCVYCGATGGKLDVEHIDGFEENDAPENLAYACRSCNATKGATFAALDIGRRTRQYNPRKEPCPDCGGLGRIQPPAPTTGWGRGPVDTWPTCKTCKGTGVAPMPNPAPNPAALAARTAAQYAAAVVDLLAGTTKTAVQHGIRIVTGTKPAKRAEYAQQLRRTNPEKVPTFEQYAYAVSIHEKGAYDEGGAIIHSTPPAKRSEYNSRLWGQRRKAYGRSGRRQESADRWE